MAINKFLGNMLSKPITYIGLGTLGLFSTLSGTYKYINKQESNIVVKGDKELGKHASQKIYIDDEGNEVSLGIFIGKDQDTRFGEKTIKYYWDTDQKKGDISTKVINNDNTIDKQQSDKFLENIIGEINNYKKKNKIIMLDEGHALQFIESYIQEHSKDISELWKYLLGGGIICIIIGGIGYTITKTP